MRIAEVRWHLMIVLVYALAGPQTAQAAAWQLVPGDLTTPWAAKVNPHQPLPEYPRPQMTRPQWVNLNGLWDYAIVSKDAGTPQKFDGRILVPFGVESALSGVKKPLLPDQRLWYRRTFTAPDLSGGKRLLLHFGAVDYQATVYVNGKQVGEHKGGYDRFTLDITDVLKTEKREPEKKVEKEKPAPSKPSPAKPQPVAKSATAPKGRETANAPAASKARDVKPQDRPAEQKAQPSSPSVKSPPAPERVTNELTVSVWDPTDTAPIAVGKQSLHPHGSRYTATSGIWQTVWLEAVPSASIDRLEMTPDVDRCCLKLVVKARGNARGCTVEAAAKGRNRVAGMVAGGPNEKLSLDVQEVRVWQPDDPFLYDLTVALKRDGQIIDTVTSYFAMRKIEVGRDAEGHDRILLNGRETFHIGLLDQGFWPDGIYTAPTDEALRFDVETARRMGFNTIRKHVKVEPDRWYYHCDRSGVMVWQDVVSRMMGPERDIPEARQQFETEIQAMLGGLANHPSIVMWVLFNEGWGSYDQARLAASIKRQDPSRLVNAHSGGEARGDGETVDVHSYCYAQLPQAARGKASVVGELGGVAAPIAGHKWRPRAGYGHGQLKAWEIGLFYEDLTNRLRPMIAVGLCGAIYTQPYDLEIEENGLATYDRKVFKVRPEALYEINRSLVQTGSGRLVSVLPTAERGAEAWTYAAQPPAGDWKSPRFDDSGWALGLAPFGTVPQARTRWTTKEIWLRRSFTLEKAVKMPRIPILHGGDAEVFIDGHFAAACKGSVSSYTLEDVLPEAAVMLTPGRHVLAIHCRQESGAQVLDAGIAELRMAAAAPAIAQRPIPLVPHSDLPYAPGGKYLEHDMSRPRPPVVDVAGVGPMGLAARAPSDAAVLFDGKDLSQWQSFETGLAGPASWKVENGYMEVAPKGGNIYSKRKFGDCQIHIEWAPPAVVRGTGQGRGNSGIFPLGFGEIQVLDSFQNDTYPDGQAAGIYGHYPPLVNPARGPGQWQAYDIVFQMAKLDKQGRIVRPARMTVFFNGVLVHHALDMPGRQREGTIGLQDHHDPVRYRNIWVRRLADYDEAGTPPPARPGTR